MSRLLLSLFLSSFALAVDPPILSRPLASQLVPGNPAISSVFLVPSSSSLLANVSASSPALRVPPSWSFSIGFSGATFLPLPGDTNGLSFHAQLKNGDPLPDWLYFSQVTITFGGVAPKQAQGIQVLDIVVTAASSSSSTTSDTFTLIVAPHDLSLSGPLLTRNVTADTRFSVIINDWQGVQVDGATVKSSSLISANTTNNVDWATAPDLQFTPPLNLALDTASFSWLIYDASSRTLSGTPPVSFVNAPGPTIPAFITLASAPQPLTVSTNLTLSVHPSAFIAQTLPPLLTVLDKNLSFALGPFLSPAVMSNINVSASWDPGNATWLAFDTKSMILSGSVPHDAPSSINVAFEAHDAVSGTTSRTGMLLSVSVSDGAESGRTPTDHALRRTGKKLGVAVGVVFGILSSIILLAIILAICRRCCVAHESIDGAYVIDQSAFENCAVNKGKSSFEKSVDCESVYPATSSVASECPCVEGIHGEGHTKTLQVEGRTMSKAAFFGAVRERFGSDGSWRAKRNGGAGFSGKRARKSKISKPMVILSSSTSVREGFGDRARSGISKIGKPNAGGNFTIFGNGNNREESSMRTVNANDTPSPGPARADLSLSLSHALKSPSAGPSAVTTGLGYDCDQSHSNSNPSRTSESLGGSPNLEQRGSAPSLTTGSHSVGTQSGTSVTQSTFATEDSTRLTNAAGEIPFRRSGFDGPFETLAERNMREKSSPLAPRGPADPGVSRTPSAMLPPHMMTVQTAEFTVPSVPPKTQSPVTVGLPKIPPKATGSLFNSATPTTMRTPSKVEASAASSMLLKPSQSAMPANSDSTTTKGGAVSPAKGDMSMSSTPLGSTTFIHGSANSLGAPSLYRNGFFGDKGSDSDSSSEDVGHTVIKKAVKRTSSEMPVKQAIGFQTPVQHVAGKPRLVAFTHERTPASSGPPSRRNVSQRVVLQGGDDSDVEAAMRIGMEYVRQLGHPEFNHDAVQAIASSSRISVASHPPHTPSGEFYASNDSNDSIAGRTRVLAPLVVSSHRNRRQGPYSMESTDDSFASYVEREGSPESQWMTEAAQKPIGLVANEPFNFAAPLDSARDKHASALAGSALEARQADGRALPEWLRFDKAQRQFWGVPPRGNHGERGATLVARVVVKIWEGEKGEVVGGCVIEVREMEE